MCKTWAWISWIQGSSCTSGVWALPFFQLRQHLEHPASNQVTLRLQLAQTCTTNLVPAPGATLTTRQPPLPLRQPLPPNVPPRPVQVWCGARLGAVGHSVLNCNVFKTKVHNPADRHTSTARRGLEATAALPLMYGGMAMPAYPWPCRRTLLSSSRHLAPRSPELSHALVERICKTSASDELMMMCGAQRALQGSASVGYDGLAPPVR